LAAYSLESVAYLVPQLQRSNAIVVGEPSPNLAPVQSRKQIVGVHGGDFRYRGLQHQTTHAAGETGDTAVERPLSPVGFDQGHESYGVSYRPVADLGQVGQNLATGNRPPGGVEGIQTRTGRAGDCRRDDLNQVIQVLLL